MIWIGTRRLSDTGWAIGSDNAPNFDRGPIESSIAISTKNVHTQYRQISNISRTLVGNKIVDHSDVFGASPVGAAPTISLFST